MQQNETAIPSLMDTWILLANDNVGDVHRRGLYVLESRGVAHSNQIREVVLTDRGLNVLDPAGPPLEASAVRHMSLEGRGHHAAVI